MKYSLTKYWKEVIEKQKEHLINCRDIYNILQITKHK